MDISPVAEARNEYTYSASGAKLKVVQKWNPNYNTAPVIGSAINTALLTQTKTTDYVGNIIYENNVLKRILVDGGYIEGGVYYYYLTDHLGNNRVVANASGTAIQRNHYYPFGTSFADTPMAEQGKQPYKYNNKELDMMHGLNLYDYSARFKDDFRFITVDPLAEKYYSWSPYVYVANNPLKFVDIDGREIGPPDKPIKLKMSPKMEKLQSIASQHYKNSPEVFKGSSVSVSLSAFKIGGGVGLGPVVKVRGEAKVLNVETKISTEGPELTVSGAELSGNVRMADALQTGGKVTVLQGKVTLDKDGNAVSETTDAKASGSINVGNKVSVSTSDASTFSLGGSLSYLSAKISINVAAGAKTLGNILEAIATVVMPTHKDPEIKETTNN